MRTGKMFRELAAMACGVGRFILLSSPVPMTAAIIDFDDVTNGTVVDTHYPGVTFGCVVCTSGHAYARDMNTCGSPTAASGSNVVTLVDPASSTLTSFDTRFGALSATFAVPQRFVSIDARP